MDDLIELMKQLDLTAEVSEFNLYESQLCGYLSREYDKGKLIGIITRADLL